MALIDNNRALFAMHMTASGSGHHTYPRGSDEQRRSSRAALDTISKITVDIAHLHTRNPSGSSIKELPPFCLYIFRAGLEHLSASPYADLDAWTRDCDALRLTLKLFEERWGRTSLQL